MPPEHHKQPEHKPWLKLHSKEWLQGSLALDCTLEEQAIWAKVLAMANESRNRGVIQANPATPYPHSWLANYFHCPLDLFEATLQKLREQERITENSTGIKINNWGWYQDELYAKRPRGRPPKDTDRIKEKYGNIGGG